MPIAHPTDVAEIRTRGGHVHIRISGELDVARVPDVQRALHQALGRGPLVVDLSPLSFVDSTAIGMLLGLMRRASEDDLRVTIMLPNGMPLRALRQAGVAELLAVGVVGEAGLFGAEDAWAQRAHGSNGADGHGADDALLALRAPSL